MMSFYMLLPVWYWWVFGSFWFLRCCFPATRFLPILGNLNFLEPSGPLQAYNRTELHFYIFMGRDIVLSIGKRYGLAVRGTDPAGDIFCTHPKRPEEPLSPCKIGIGFSQRQNGRNVLLTTQHLSTLRIKKE